MALGLGASLGKTGVVTPAVVTDCLFMKHMYPAGAVQTLSDGAVYFSGPGNDDYIDCGAINVGTTFSAGGWFWINSTGQDQYATLLGQAIYDSIGGHIEGFILRLSTNNLMLTFGDDSIGANDSITITNFLTTTGNTNNWVHLYFTISADATGSKISKLYQNGALIATDTIVNFEGVHSSSNFTIGKADNLNNTTSALNGYASNVSLYSTELTQAQIKSIMWKQYADLTTSEKTSLVSWWNLDSLIDSNMIDNNAGVYDNHNTTLGSEEIDDGTFPESPTGWTLPTGWTWDSINKRLKHTAHGGTAENAYEVAGLASNKVWKMTADVTVDAGSVYFSIGGYDLSDYISESGTYTKYIINDHASQNGRIYVIPNGNTFSGSIDNISVKQVNGNTGQLL